MMLNAPAFVGHSGYFRERNIETAFTGVNEGLDTLRTTLGEERYTRMRHRSDQMRALFEADPETQTGETIAGCRMIHDMQRMLRRKRGGMAKSDPA